MVTIGGTMEIDKEFIKDNEALVQSLLLKKNSSLSEEDLKDLHQDTFEKCLLYKDYYDETKGAVGTWLGLIVTHVYDRYIRSTDALDSDVSDIDQEEYDDLSLVDLLTSSDNHYFMHNKEQVQYYIGMLPKAQQDKLYLHLILGYTHDEISEALDITPQSSRTLCSAAVKNLRQLVESDDPDKEVLKEPELLQSRSKVPYSGDWSWRPNETPDRSPGLTKIFTASEVQQYCKENNLAYKYAL